MWKKILDRIDRYVIAITDGFVAGDLEIWKYKDKIILNRLRSVFCFICIIVRIVACVIVMFDNLVTLSLNYSRQFSRLWHLEKETLFPDFKGVCFIYLFFANKPTARLFIDDEMFENEKKNTCVGSRKTVSYPVSTNIGK